MSTIRRQSLISSAVIYSGFALGLFNTWLFTRKGGFTVEQYGLVGIFMAMASIMFSLSSLGMPAVVSKFFPYYRAHLPRKKNDLLSVALFFPLAGFLLVLAAGFIFRDFVTARFANSPQFVEYYYWLFPFGLGYTIFMVLEAYAWQMRKPVLSNFLREVLFRLLTTLLILFMLTGLFADFDAFISSFSFIYLLLALIMILFFAKRNEFHLTTKVSKVTRRLKKKISALASFVWGGGLVYNIAQVFDTIVIAAVLPNGLATAAIYTLAQNVSSLIQAPQRGVISSALGPISQAWKDKDYGRIQRIYQRSSINQLLFSLAMFCLIWLNFTDGVITFQLKETYLYAQTVFFFIGLTRILDMGTGLNGQIISTSTFWRFEFVTGLILLAMTLPLTYFLALRFGVVGPAISNLIAFTIYNGIRYTFLYRRFRMQPFTRQTIYSILLAVACYYIAWFLFREQTGFLSIMLRSMVFVGLFGAGAWIAELSPDIKPVVKSLGRRIGIK